MDNPMELLHLFHHGDHAVRPNPGCPSCMTETSSKVCNTTRDHSYASHEENGMRGEST